VSANYIAVVARGPLERGSIQIEHEHDHVRLNLSEVWEGLEAILGDYDLAATRGESDAEAWRFAAERGRLGRGQLAEGSATSDNGKLRLTSIPSGSFICSWCLSVGMIVWLWCEFRAAWAV
jgi:hypothetical protein